MAEIALGGLEKEDKELHQLDRAVFSKVPFVSLQSVCLFASLASSCLPLPSSAWDTCPIYLVTKYRKSKV